MTSFCKNEVTVLKTLSLNSHKGISNLLPGDSKPVSLSYFLCISYTTSAINCMHQSQNKQPTKSYYCDTTLSLLLDFPGQMYDGNGKVVFVFPEQVPSLICMYLGESMHMPLSYNTYHNQHCLQKQLTKISFHSYPKLWLLTSQDHLKQKQQIFLFLKTRFRYF